MWSSIAARSSAEKRRLDTGLAIDMPLLLASQDPPNCKCPCIVHAFDARFHGNIAGLSNTPALLLFILTFANHTGMQATISQCGRQRTQTFAPAHHDIEELKEHLPSCQDLTG